jgi:hypothetical protein
MVYRNSNKLRGKINPDKGYNIAKQQVATLVKRINVTPTNVHGR